MIEYNYLTEFHIENEVEYTHWLTRVIMGDNKELGTISYVFCADEYLLDLNLKHLNHDTFTDIITFDYSEGQMLAGDIFISIERVEENAREYKVSFADELKRVMVHGILHLMGHKDKTEEEVVIMRRLEDIKINMFHVEQ